MRVLVCDDHAMLAACLAHHFQERGHTARVSSHPSEALSALRASPFDLCLLDARFGDDLLAGVTAISAIRVVAPRTTIVVLSGAVTEAVAQLALVAGARAVADKSLSLAALDQLVSEVVTTPRPAAARRDARPTALTHRERELLELVGNGLSSREIGAELGISPHTVRSHLESARRKLDARNQVEALTASTWADAAEG
ncbi:MAG: response regulator containing a CheY-like receiver domain and an DNA-binding domain [Frankiales bacterium]|nr:response regulator containing a CheY-like receiver domain and an DNA-binding domain [Frankiales bacterium]